MAANTPESTSSQLKFLELVGKLKHIQRTGWVLRNVKQPESIAGHMYRMAIITFLLDGKEQLDKVKCMELALVHDLAECIVGDLTPFCGIDPIEKHRREDNAMKELSQMVGSSNGNHIYHLYKEYECQETAEAQLVKELDRFDMTLQAFEYEKEEGSPGRLQEFFDSTNGKFRHPLIAALVSELNMQRSVHAKQSAKLHGEADQRSDHLQGEGDQRLDQLSLMNNSGTLTKVSNQNM